MSTTETKYRPITLTGDEVRAFLDGRKTQIRRDIKGVERWPMVRGCAHGAAWATPDNRPYPEHGLIKCPFGKPGDRLWVRETWCQKAGDAGIPVYNAEGNLDSSCVYHRATTPDVRRVDGDGFGEYNRDGTEKSPWKSPMQMSRWASRITLEVTDVRVERLWDIGLDDIEREGIVCCYRTPLSLRDASAYRYEFHEHWDSINAKNGHGWDANPWVWVGDIKRVDT